MDITKEIQITKTITVIDESKINVGNKVLYKHRSFCDVMNEDFWEEQTRCIVRSVYEDFICVDDLDYPGYCYSISAKDLSEGMYCSIEIIE